MKKGLLANILLLNLSLNLSLLSLSQSALACEEKHFYSEHYKLERIATASGNCLVAFTPLDLNQLVYRAFSFDRFGKLMVFNSYGEGSISTHTGARVFFLFPRKNFPDFISPHLIQTANSSSFEISPATGEILSFKPGTIAVSPQVIPTNAGGFEITHWPGVYLDSGFSLGKDPTSATEGKSVFKNSLGQTCKVKNSILFTSSSGNSRVNSSGESFSDPRLSFTDEELPEKLKTWCPDFQPFSL